MSAIFGFVNLDGAPAQQDELARMAAALAHRGPHGVRLHLAGEAGLGHCLLVATPEAGGERQPLIAAPTEAQGAALLLTADARLDNRAELLDLLDGQIIPGGAGGEITDPDLILAAYRRWGEDCPAHLIGDFAFALYAPAIRRLFLARDACGVRQLVYARQGARIVFATGLEALTAILPPQPANRKILAEMAAGIFDRFVAETPYREIQRVPPAHSLAFTPQGVHLRRYYTFGLDDSARGLSAAERVERLAELLGQAARAALRSATPPAAIAGAGGLDSGGLMCLAQREIAAGRAQAGVGVYAAVFPQTPAAGEDEYLQAIEGVCPDLAFCRVDCETDWYMKPVPYPADFPMDDLDILTPEWAWMYHLMRAAQQDGRRVFMTGSYGDHIFGEWVYDTLNSMAARPVSAWRSEWPYYRRRLRRSLWREIPLALLSVYTPAELRRRARRRLGWRGPTAALRSPQLPQQSDFVHMPAPAGLNAAARRMHERVFNGLAAARHLAMDQVGGRLGLEVRWPFLYRPLLDFVLQMNAADLAQQGVTRLAYRRAMGALLPPELLERTSKVSFMHLVRRGLAQVEKERIQAMLRDPGIGRAGLLDADELRRAFEAYCDGAELTYRRVLRPLAVEIWLNCHPGVAESLISGEFSGMIGTVD